MKNFLRKLFSRESTAPLPEVTPPPIPDVTKPKKPRRKKPVQEKNSTLTPKEAATLAGEPYVNIIKVEVNPDNINDGTFELDWNDKFVMNLIRGGYKIREDDTDAVIVDRWFQSVCRNIALELYEQQQADPKNRDVRAIATRDLGGGYTEVS